MSVRRLWVLGFVLPLLLALGLPALAQDYSFQVPENRSTLTVNPDASVRVEYSLTFANNASGKPIDVVDIGLPDSGYDLSSAKAEVDGTAITDIRKSEYVTHGVEVHLGEKTIPSGATGTLTFSILCRNRVFRETEDPNSASMEFSPTWYGAEFTSGTTHLTCTFVLPEGVGPDDPRYHGTEFTRAEVVEGRVHYVWEMADASPSSQYTFGASFPAKVMQRVVEPPPPPGLFETLVVGFLTFIVASLPCLFPLVIVGIIAFSIWRAWRRRYQYLPPKLGMEGVEVRRGLTVPEVAVLMEEKVDKVMALLLFGMIRKGMVKVVGQKPLKLQLLEGKEPGTSYEAEFAKAIKGDGKLDEDEASRVLIDLVKRVQEKMKGFSRKKSLLYYRDIMRKAWDQVGTDDYSQAFEWLILDEEFPKTARERFPSDTMPLPTWFPEPYRVPRTMGGGGTTLPSAPLPSPTAAADSIVRGFESFSRDLVNSVPGLASKVTNKTNPVPVSHSSGGRSSGGGCACACACAGCACACAGGGR